MKLPFLKQKASALSAMPQPFMAITGLARPRWTSRRYDAQVEEGFRRNVIVWRCVTLVAEAAATIPLVLYDGKDRIITKHKLLDLLQRPNPLHSKTDFLAALYTSWLLAGNVYIEAVRPDDGPPTELYQLRPDRMRVLPGPAGLPLGYEYSLNGAKHVWPTDMLTGACDVLHWKNFNPLDDWYGLAPLDAAQISIDQHNAASSWNQALLNQAARPSGALVYKPKDGPNNLSHDQLSRLREEFDAYYSGARNAGRPMILEGGLEWQSLALTPQDMEWLKGRDAAARDIALAFGVPAQLIGLTDTQTYSNMVEARLALYEEAVLPLARRLLCAINTWLLPMFTTEKDSKTYRLDLDTDEVSALAPRRESAWKKVENATFLTVNEKRTALGYSKIEGGDVL